MTTAETQKILDLLSDGRINSEQALNRNLNSLQAMPFDTLQTAHMLKNFKQHVSPQNPLYIEAHEDDGEHVMIWIG